MMGGSLERQSVFDALAWIDMTKSSGALRVTGEESGAVFYADGLVYFGMVDGRKLTVQELERAGIAKQAWTSAGARSDTDLSFAEKLVEAGATPEAVRTFVWNRIIDVVSSFAALGSGEFVTAPGRHGFGSTVSFRVDDVVLAVRRGLDAGVGAPGRVAPEDVASGHVAPQYFAAGQVTFKPATVDVKITAEDWNTLMSLIPTMTFSELVEKTDSFAADRLVTALSVDGLIDVAAPPGLPSPRRMELPPPPPPLVESRHSSEPGGDRYDFGGRAPARAHHDPELPETFAVGRDTYAAMAGIRTTTTEHDTTAKTSALRRLIDAVRGL